MTPRNAEMWRNSAELAWPEDAARDNLELRDENYNRVRSLRASKVCPAPPLHGEERARISRPKIRSLSTSGEHRERETGREREGGERERASGNRARRALAVVCKPAMEHRAPSNAREKVSFSLATRGIGKLGSAREVALDLQLVRRISPSKVGRATPSEACSRRHQRRGIATKRSFFSLSLSSLSLSLSLSLYLSFPILFQLRA